MSRVYADQAAYEAYTGGTAPSGVDGLLAAASRMLDGRVFRLCVYDADPGTGMPTNPLVVTAFSDAVCAQVQWWDELGDHLGAAAAGWGTVQIGTAKLGRSTTDVSGEAAPARQVAPAVWDALRAPDLTPDVVALGEVTTW
jgi:hypothetical protein